MSGEDFELHALTFLITPAILKKPSPPADHLKELICRLGACVHVLMKSYNNLNPEHTVLMSCCQETCRNASFLSSNAMFKWSLLVMTKRCLIMSLLTFIMFGAAKKPQN